MSTIAEEHLRRTNSAVDSLVRITTNLTTAMENTQASLASVYSKLEKQRNDITELQSDAEGHAATIAAQQDTIDALVRRDSARAEEGDR